MHGEGNLRSPCGKTVRCEECRMCMMGKGSIDDRTKGQIRLPQNVLWGERRGEDLPGGAYDGSRCGIAFDLGTTTVAAMLWDLTGGMLEPVASISISNPQRIHGADVISRIEYVGGDPERLQEMQRLITEAMNRLMDGLSEQNAVVTRLAAVGNPTMMHFLFGKDPSGLAKAPFHGEELPLEIDAAELGLSVEPGVKLRTLPVMGGHLGADAAAAMLAARLLEQKEPVMLVDVGTNGELLMTDGRGSLWGCSTAAGPAFEGGSISPGSKFIDAAAAMLDQGWMDEEGVVNRPGLLSQKDVRQLQMAKAAVAAGAEILAARLQSGEPGTNSYKIILAGTFGNHIQPKNAVRIGLLPKGCNIEGCGNLAGVGASLILLSESEWKRGQSWAARVRHVELADQPQFTEAFLRNMYFP